MTVREVFSTDADLIDERGSATIYVQESARQPIKDASSDIAAAIATVFDAEWATSSTTAQVKQAVADLLLP
jgi:hypothetical protein